MHPVPARLGLALLLVLVAGCSGSSSSTSSGASSSATPPSAVCADIGTVKQTVQSLQNTKLERGALPSLQADLTRLREQLTTLKADAKEQYAPERAQLSLSLTAAAASLKNAVADPSVTTLAAVGPSLAAVKVSADSLVSAVSRSC